MRSSFFYGLLGVCTASIAPLACGSADDASSGIADDEGGASDGAPSDGAALSDGSSSQDSGPDTGCPSEMARIEDFCVDKWEAHVVELDDGGNETPHSPYDVVDGLRVRAKSAGAVVPQGYISQTQATAACDEAGKRLCSPDEFSMSCRGVHSDAGTPYYPYGGTTHEPGTCNEGKGSSVAKFFGPDPNAWTYADFNDPILNDWDGGLATTGSFAECVSPHGTYDCVGNLHEWTNDAPDVNGHGRFRGGFYGDAEINGPGCLYVTSAHAPSYHDYSTGFRCCKDALP